jgi:hypothetical protein
MTRTSTRRSTTSRRSRCRGRARRAPRVRRDLQRGARSRIRPHSRRHARRARRAHRADRAGAQLVFDVHLHLDAGRGHAVSHGSRDELLAADSRHEDGAALGSARSGRDDAGRARSAVSFTGDPRPAYEGSLADKASAFELEPGIDVHHPFIAPHLVHTRSGLSISLAITFRTPKSDESTDAHRFNHLLMRRAGLVS